MALLRVLQNKLEGCQDLLGACCLQQAQAKGECPGHLLWALYFIKLCPKQGPGCLVLGASASTVDLKTHHKLVWVYVKATTKLVDMVMSLLYFLHVFIDLLSTATASKDHRRQRMPLPSIRCCCHMPLSSTVVISHRPPPRRLPRILFDSHKKGDILKDCLMTVDGTDFHVPQKGMATKRNAFASHKYAGKSTLCHKLGVSILGVTWCGSRVHTQRVSSLILNIQQSTASFLDLGKQVEADEVYVRHPDKIKCPQNVGNPAEKWVMQGRVRVHHKTLNGWLKNGGSSHRSTVMTSCGMAMCSRHVQW
jgi:hypothetical protein